MKAEILDAVSLAPMVKKLWPEHDLEALVRILTEYIASPESAVFACRYTKRISSAKQISYRQVHHPFPKGTDIIVKSLICS